VKEAGEPLVKEAGMLVRNFELTPTED